MKRLSEIYGVNKTQKYKTSKETIVKKRPPNELLQWGIKKARTERLKTTRPRLKCEDRRGRKRGNAYPKLSSTSKDRQKH